MKGDGNIKKVILKFLGTGIFDKYQAYVKIFDSKKIYYCGYTYNGEIKLKLEKNKSYKVLATFRNEIISTVFYVTNQNIYLFYFNSIIHIPIHTITFQLNDYYYKIPITKGEIILGKNN